MRSLRSSVGVWLLAICPLVVFGLMASRERIPENVRAASVDLAGEWEWVGPGEGAPVKLPGRIGQGRKMCDDCTIRRRFELGASASQERFFLVLSVKHGTLVPSLNGTSLGASDDYIRGSRAEYGGLQGWDVPPGVARGGVNELAVAVLRPASIEDPRLLLGPATALKSYFLKATDAKRFFLQGSIYLAAFLAVLLALMLRLQVDAAARRRTVATLALLLFTGTWAAANAGVAFPLPDTSLGFRALVYALVPMMCLALIEFHEEYFRGAGRNRFRLTVRVALSSVAVLSVLLAAIGSPAHAKVPMLAAPMCYLSLIIGFGRVIRALMTKPRDFGPLLFATDFTLLAAGTLDFLTDLHFIQAPRMFVIAGSSSAILSSVVILGEFLQISHRNNELTGSLARTNVELADALVKAQEASRLKSEFVANVSHELRTPLNSVINIPEGLIEQFEKRPSSHCERCGRDLESAADEATPSNCPNCGAADGIRTEERYELAGDPNEMVDHLRTINRSGRHLLNLVNDVLDFSKLESGRAKLLVEDVDALSAAREVSEALGPLAAKHQVTVKVAPPAAPVVLRVDRVKLNQVLFNLLGNAIKFSPAGGQVEVRLAPEGQHCRVEVQDHGIGIPEDHHHTIFESFRQVDGTNTRRFGGTGLGLAITRKLVELHGGEVGLRSRPGAGSTFWFKLPLAASSGDAPPQSATG